MRVGVIGLGAVGTRVARRLADRADVEEIEIEGSDSTATARVAAAIGPKATAARVAAVDVAVIAAPCGLHVELARRALDAGAHIVSVSDSIGDVAGLLRLDELAQRAGRTIVVGAGLAPGMGCLIARFLADQFDEVTEVHVAKVGTGGPACARQHHKALGSEALDWRDSWIRRPGGSGRELCWFPDPIGGHDCYRGALADTLLLRRYFESASRITARMSATRRDRLSMHLPMLRKPHPEGLEGAVRVEVRGRMDGATTSRIAGAVERPAVGAAIVASVVAGRLGASRFASGATGLAGHPDSGLLADCDAAGLGVMAFSGHT